MMQRNISFIYKIFLFLFFIFFTNAYAEPNKELYGSKANYPLVNNIFNSELDPYVIAEYSGQRFEKENLHPNFDKEIHWVRKFGKVQEFPLETVKWPSGNNPEKWVEKFPILSIVVYKDGKIIFEKYQYDRKPTQRYNSQSMAKTLTAMAVGIAVSEKLIDIEKPASYYIKELEGTILGSASVRNHLKMSTGSSFKWDAKGDARTYFLNKYANKSCNMDKCGVDVLEVWKQEKSIHPAGKVWNYDPQSSDILSLIISRTTGKNLNKYWEEKVWSKIGPERDAFWRKIRFTDATSGANFFFATPRDFIKIGKIFTDNNQNIIPASWLDQMVEDALPTQGKMTNWGSVSPNLYGYQTWIKKNSWIAMAGHRGQKLFIDRKNNTIMFVCSVQGDWSLEGIKWFEWVSKQSLNKLTQ